MLLLFTLATALAGDATDAGVVLHAPGAAPHEPLRYAFVTGGEQSADLKVNGDAQFSMMGREQRVPTPEITVRLNSSVLGVDDGVAQVRVRYGDVSFAPTGISQLDRALGKELPKLKGLEGTLRIDARGRSEAVEFDLSSLKGSAREQAEGAIDVSQTLVPFPEEPIGIGARWSQSLTTEAQGLQIGTEVTYTLVDRDDKSVTIKSETSQRLLGGKLTGTPIPLDVTRLDGGGGGTTHIILSQALPRSSEVRSKIEMALSATMMGASLEGTQTINNAITLRPATP